MDPTNHPHMLQNTQQHNIYIYPIQRNPSKSDSLYTGIPSILNMSSGPKSTYRYFYIYNPYKQESPLPNISSGPKVVQFRGVSQSLNKYINIQSFHIGSVQLCYYKHNTITEISQYECNGWSWQIYQEELALIIDLPGPPISFISHECTHRSSFKS